MAYNWLNHHGKLVSVRRVREFKQQAQDNVIRDPFRHPEHYHPASSWSIPIVLCGLYLSNLEEHENIFYESTTKTPQEILDRRISEEGLSSLCGKCLEQPLKTRVTPFRLGVILLAHPGVFRCRCGCFPVIDFLRSDQEVRSGYGM